MNKRYQPENLKWAQMRKRLESIYLTVCVLAGWAGGDTRGSNPTAYLNLTMPMPEGRMSNVWIDWNGAVMGSAA